MVYILVILPVQRFGPECSFSRRSCHGLDPTRSRRTAYCYVRVTSELRFTPLRCTALSSFRRSVRVRIACDGRRQQRICHVNSWTGYQRAGPVAGESQSTCSKNGACNGACNALRWLAIRIHSRPVLDQAFADNAHLAFSSTTLSCAPPLCRTRTISVLCSKQLQTCCLSSHLGRPQSTTQRCTLKSSLICSSFQYALIHYHYFKGNSASGHNLLSTGQTSQSCHANVEGTV